MQKPKPTIKSLGIKLTEVMERKKDLQGQKVEIEQALRLAHSEYLKIMEEIKNYD